MTFPFRDSAFWGLLVLHEHLDLPLDSIEPVLFRPRLIAQWVRAADGRLERRWHRQSPSPH